MADHFECKRCKKRTHTDLGWYNLNFDGNLCEPCTVITEEEEEVDYRTLQKTIAEIKQGSAEYRQKMKELKS